MKTEVTVRNCPIQFRFECSRRWEDLTVTDDPAVRHCGRCRNDVFFCATDEQTIAHARDGHCIARELPDASEQPAIFVGQPAALPEITAAQAEAQRWKRRESGIDDAIRNAKDAPRSCAQCGFPAPAWRKTCRVCTHEMGRAVNAPGK